MRMSTPKFLLAETANTGITSPETTAFLRIPERRPSSIFSPSRYFFKS
jgi:hypothetical protein